MHSRQSAAIAKIGLLLTLLVAPVANAQPEQAAPSSPDSQSAGASSAQLWRDRDPGQPLHLLGRVVSVSGAPVAGATIQLRQADGAGNYHSDRYRARLISRASGEFNVATAVPNSSYGPGHIHVTVSHPDYQPLTSRVLFLGDPELHPSDEALAIPLEEVRREGESLMVGDVQFELAPR